MIKRYLALLLLIALLFTPAASFAETTELTVDEVVQLALRRQVDLQILQIELEQIERDIEAYTGWFQTADPASISSLVSIFGPRLKALYDKRGPLVENIEVKRLKVAYEAEDALYSYLTAKKQYEVQSALAKSITSRFNVEQGRLQQGLTSELTLATLALRVDEATLGLEKGANTVESTLMRLNSLLNRTLTEKIEVSNDVSYEPVEVSLDTSLAKALNPSYGELKKASLLYSTLLQSHNGGVEWGYPSEQGFELRVAGIRVQQAQQAVELSIRTKVNDVLYAEQAVSVAQKAHSLEQRKLTVEEKRLTYGLTTHLAVVDQANLVATKELDLQQKIYQYRRAVLILRLAEQGL